MAAVNVDEVTECVRNQGFVFRHPVWPFASFGRPEVAGLDIFTAGQNGIGQNSANYLFQTSWLLECVSHHYNLLILGHD